MTDSKHTKGPWKFKTAANGDCGVSAEGTGVFIECFAEIRHAGENARDEALANARLVIAIPELLEALREIIRKDDTGPMAFELRENGPSQAIGGSEGKFAAIARAAIAKAGAQ